MTMFSTLVAQLPKPLKSKVTFCPLTVPLMPLAVKSPATAARSVLLPPQAVSAAKAMTRRHNELNKCQYSARNAFGEAAWHASYEKTITPVGCGREWRADGIGKFMRVASPPLGRGDAVRPAAGTWTQLRWPGGAV